MKTAGYPEFFHPYISKVPEGKDPVGLLAINLKSTIKSLAMVSEDQTGKGYAEGKWSIKEVVQHMIDTERIFCFRALAIARGEKGKIPGFDHNQYADNSDANRRSLKSLLEEMRQVRAASIALFQSFTPEMFTLIGNANGLEISAEQLLYILIGHELHHLQILEERYL